MDRGLAELQSTGSQSGIRLCFPFLPFLSSGDGGYSVAVVHRLLIVVPSLVSSMGSRVQGLSDCSPRL